MSLRRELAVSVLACVLGAVLALLTTSRTWVVRVRVQPAPLPPLHIVHTGAAEVPSSCRMALTSSWLLPVGLAELTLIPYLASKSLIIVP